MKGSQIWVLPHIATILKGYFIFSFEDSLNWTNNSEFNAKVIFQIPKHLSLKSSERVASIILLSILLFRNNSSTYLILFKWSSKKISRDRKKSELISSHRLWLFKMIFTVLLSLKYLHRLHYIDFNLTFGWNLLQ